MSLKDLTYSIKFENESSSLKEILTAEKEIDNGFKNAASSSDKMSSSIDKVAKVSQNATDNSKGIDDSFKKAASSASETGSGIDDVAKSSKDAATEGKEIDKNLKDAAKSASEMGDKINDSGSKANKSKSMIERIKDAFKGAIFGAKKTGDETEKIGLKAKLSEISVKSLMKAAAGGYVTKKLIDFGKDSAKVFMDFQQSMANVKATLGLSGAEGEQQYKKLWGAAKQAGAETRFNSMQAAEALNYEATAGMNATQAIDGLPHVLNLASAGGIDLARSSEIMTTSMSTLGLEIKDIPNLIDQMAVTAQSSNTNIDKLGESIQSVGSVAKDAGMDTASMNAELGILANSGFRGAEGGTALRNVLLNLTAPTDKVKETLGNLGVKISDANGKLKPLNNILLDLKGKMKGMTQEQQQSIKAMIGGKENVAALSVLLDGAGDSYENLKNKILDSKGAAEQMAEAQNDTVAGAWDNLTSAIEDVQISMFDSTNAGDGFKTMLQDITAAIPGIKNEIIYAMNTFGEFVSFIIAHKDVIIPAVEAIIAVFAGFKILSMVSGLYRGWQTAIEMVTIAQGALNLIMSANPIGLVITVVAALIGWLIHLYNTSETARNVMDGFFGGLRDFGVKCINAVIDAVNKAIDGLNKLIDLANKVPGIDIDHVGNIQQVGKDIPKNNPRSAYKRKKARGTVNAEAGPTLVGELGPEIVNLNNGDTVTPANTTNRLFNESQPVASTTTTNMGGNLTFNPKFEIKINADGNTNAADVAVEVDRQMRSKFNDFLEEAFGTVSLQLGYTDI